MNVAKQLRKCPPRISCPCNMEHYGNYTLLMCSGRDDTCDHWAHQDCTQFKDVPAKDLDNVKWLCAECASA